MIDTRFENIRPYNDDELHDALHCLLNEEAFLSLMDSHFSDLQVRNSRNSIENIKTVKEFQIAFMFPILQRLIIDRLCSSFTQSGEENIKGPALLMSNHRDIVIDPAFICMALVKCGKDSCEIAIGDNLLATKWIETLVRINKSFIVRRGLPRGEQPRAFLQLSGYIRHALTEKRHSVWIAQREGRAKDSNDRTQESILKMFALSGDGSFIENLKSLNIIPVAFSYEYDPCDYLKAKEFQQKRDNSGFVKSKEDDLVSMQTGIMGFKGNVHVAFTPSINPKLDALAKEGLSKKDMAAEVCRICDRQIFEAYKIYPINRVAYDLLSGEKRFENEYTKDEYQHAVDYFDGQLRKISLENKDEEFLRRKLLEMYANPLINHLNISK